MAMSAPARRRASCPPPRAAWTLRNRWTSGWASSETGHQAATGAARGGSRRVVVLVEAVVVRRAGRSRFVVACLATASTYWQRQCWPPHVVPAVLSAVRLRRPAGDGTAALNAMRGLAGGPMCCRRRCATEGTACERARRGDEKASSRGLSAELRPRGGPSAEDEVR